MDLLGAYDGSGKYDALKSLDIRTSDLKFVNVKPADCHLTSDNEQVLSKSYRLFGSEADRKLQVNVINNWNVSYFCKEEDLETPGIQQDTAHIPDWFCTMRKDVLEECKILPSEKIQPLDKYQEVTLSKIIENSWDCEDTIGENIKFHPPKLSGVERSKLCRNVQCENVLPEAGKGSRTCLLCKAPWTEQKVDKTRSEVDGKKVKEHRSIEQRIEFFSPFMKSGEEPSLKNVDHRHSIIPIVEQLPAMQGNPSSLENVRLHARQYGSFIRVPKYCNADPSYLD